MNSVLRLFLFDHGGPGEAERAFDALIEQAPDDAAAYHNKGTLLMGDRRHDEAVRSYECSLRYRPNYAATYLNLGYALQETGRLDEAAAAWEQVRLLAPTTQRPGMNWRGWDKHRYAEHAPMSGSEVNKNDKPRAGTGCCGFPRSRTTPANRENRRHPDNPRQMSWRNCSCEPIITVRLGTPVARQNSAADTLRSRCSFRFGPRRD